MATTQTKNGQPAIYNASAPTLTDGQGAALNVDVNGNLKTVGATTPAATSSLVSGVTAALTDTTSTQVLAAPATGLRNYITTILVTNSHATVSTFVTIRDGNGGTIIWEGYALAAGGGFTSTLPIPLKQPTTAIRLDAKCETTGSNVIVSIAGYTGA